MATTNAGAFTIAREGMSILPSGDVSLSIRYTNAGGRVVTERQLSIPADATQPITDQFGAHVTAQVPAALASAVTAFLAQIDSALSAGAGAGKLDL